MEKIEMVRVRSTPEAVSEAMPTIKKRIDSLRRELVAGDIRVMQHNTYLGDISVFIVWDSDRGSEKSREGLLMAEILQEIGAQNHFIWLSK